MSGIVIGGIGNVLCGDDAAGPYLIQQLEARYDFDEPVRLVDFGTPGLDFVAQISDLDALILVDATDNDKPAGSITEYDKQFILSSPVPMRLDPHQPALKESLWVADIDGSAPREVILIGITGEAYALNTSLSEPVRAALVPASEHVLAHLDRLKINYHVKKNPANLLPWWDVYYLQQHTITE